VGQGGDADAVDVDFPGRGGLLGEQRDRGLEARDAGRQGALVLAGGELVRTTTLLRCWREVTKPPWMPTMPLGL
jgi:hypothetical protein